MDATSTDSLFAAVDAAESAFGPVDILVNNAGIPDAQRAHKMSVELVDQVISVNLRAPWLLATEVAKRLIAARLPGRIVNISSTAHYEYNGGGAALYAVTKTAIARMTETLAVEWLSGRRAHLRRHILNWSSFPTSSKFPLPFSFFQNRQMSRRSTKRSARFPKAAVEGCAVVTVEQFKENGAKIPNICGHFGIECLSLEGFMEREGWQF